MKKEVTLKELVSIGKKTSKALKRIRRVQSVITRVIIPASILTVAAVTYLQTDKEQEETA